ncbi:hypothetical protein GCM10011494_31530 [Novosphingobium endophyticum]|uniref:Uncharacterized protein n=1 Tax=Novosphingobium endophyticum TaxID=1955250 RepID=A0A916TUI2_9SPHN|nr:hypothetical protein [Novosphingobium endophyticum]GGC10514.1 hypothetical protein GCM10011494_31530 [Novosphingobium endophyticum]
MKVAENTTATLGGANDVIGGRGGDIGLTTAEMLEGEEVHDARGLVIALVFCAACWSLLGYFLLA